MDQIGRANSTLQFILLLLQMMHSSRPNRILRFLFEKSQNRVVPRRGKQTESRPLCWPLWFANNANDIFVFERGNLYPCVGRREQLLAWSEALSLKREFRIIFICTIIFPNDLWKDAISVSFHKEKVRKEGLLPYSRHWIVSWAPPQNKRGYSKKAKRRAHSRTSVRG